MGSDEKDWREELEGVPEPMSWYEEQVLRIAVWISRVRTLGWSRRHERAEDAVEAKAIREARKLTPKQIRRLPTNDDLRRKYGLDD